MWKLNQCSFFMGQFSLQLVSELFLPNFQKQLLRFFPGSLKSSMKVVLWRNFCMLICLVSIITHLVRLCWTMPKQYKKVFLSSFVLFGMVNFESCSLQTWRLHIKNVFIFLYPLPSLAIDIPFSSFFWQICSWEFCARRHEELIPRRLLIPQVTVKCLLVMDGFVHDC